MRTILPYIAASGHLCPRDIREVAVFSIIVPDRELGMIKVIERDEQFQIVCPSLTVPLVSKKGSSVIVKRNVFGESLRALEKLFCLSFALLGHASFRHFTDLGKSLCRYCLSAFGGDLAQVRAFGRG